MFFVIQLIGLFKGILVHHNRLPVTQGCYGRIEVTSKLFIGSGYKGPQFRLFCFYTFRQLTSGSLNGATITNEGAEVDGLQSFDTRENEVDILLMRR